MTELERRALLGDQEAQKECTEQGIVLLCPLCGEANVEYGTCRCTDTTNSFDYIECEICGIRIETEHYVNSISALGKWNTRPAPPIGRCGTCKWFGAVLRSGNHTCKNYEMPYCKEYDYCSHYEPREEE